jgi:DNA-binding response OmpR family regulator
MKPRILVVDDEEMLLKATATGLRLEGYVVDKTMDPREALRWIKEEDPKWRYTAVVSDLEMPFLTGDQLCIEAHKTCDVPFILVSGKLEVFDRAEACGAVKAFTKPYARRDLITVLDILDRAFSQVVSSGKKA